MRLGFDGVHYDIEPIFPDDRHFLALLDDTAAIAHSRGGVVSVSTNEIDLFPGTGPILRTVVPRAAFVDARLLPTGRPPRRPARRHDL